MTSADRDSGAVAVMVALFVTFIILPVAAVSVDLSSSYSNRRQMQNAADVAAQAGAQEMVKGASTTAAAVDAAANQIAQINGADPTDPGYSCEVVKITYSNGAASISSATVCRSWVAGAGYNGVRVRTARSIETFFAPALGLVDGTDGVDTTRAGGEAVAAVQKVSDPLLGNSVFAMCAFSEKADNATPPLLVADADSTSGWKLNTAAIGSRYVIWSNAGGSSNLSDCGLKGESFDGRICGMDIPYCGQPVTLPGRLAIDTGAAVGPVLATMAGYPSCEPDAMDGGAFSPCAMVIPICYGSNGEAGINGRLDCADFGQFLLSPGRQNSTNQSCTFTPGQASKTICGEFRGAPQSANGRPVSGDPAAGDPYRIALVQ